MEGLAIRMEWIRRFSVNYPLSVTVDMIAELVKHHCLAFYLTAHFSQEDYPYDWQVRSMTLP